MAYRIVTTIQSRNDIEAIEEAETILETIWENKTGLWTNVMAVSIVDADDGTPVIEKVRDEETNVFT